MKTKFLCILCFICLSFLAFANSGDIKYVNAQKAILKSSTDFFAKKVATVSYGEKLYIIEEKDNWSLVTPESNTKIAAWISNANITSKKILSKRNISDSEIALAGKGFTKSGRQYNVDDDDLNYQAVVAFENINITENELKHFIREGKLSQRNSKKTFQSKVDISELEEYEIGETVAAAILSVYTEQYAPRTKNYLNLIAQSLLRTSPRPTTKYGYTVGILDTDEINAFATSGGHIFITRGLLLSAKSEDALASVIAHEIAHIHLQHNLMSLKKDRQRKKIFNQADALLTEAFGEEVLENVDFAKEIRNSVNDMVNNGYSQTCEYEADAYAIELLDNAGYDTNGMFDMLKMLKRSLNEKREFPTSGFASTHPSPDNRLTKLKHLIKNPSISKNAEKRLLRFKSIIK